jgi:hypothetical protein
MLHQFDAGFLKVEMLNYVTLILTFRENGECQDGNGGSLALIVNLEARSTQNG